MPASPMATQSQFDNPALGELYNVLVSQSRTAGAVLGCVLIAAAAKTVTRHAD